MADEDLHAELERLKAENAALKNKTSRRAQMADRRGSVLRAYFYSNLGATLDR
jgi:hypothetical protein